MINRFVIKINNHTGKVAYFVGPSIDETYNNPFTEVIECAKMYDSAGHAVLTGKRLALRYNKVIASTEIIEVSISVKATGGIVASKPSKAKNGDQSLYWVVYPEVEKVEATTDSSAST